MYYLGIHKQNLGLRKVDLEPSPTRGSDKINRVRLRKKNITENKSYIVWPGLVNQNPAPTEVDLERSAKRGSNRTKALVILY